MKQIIRLLTTLAALCAVSACSPNGETSTHNSIVGTKAIIKAHGNELLLEIKDMAAGTIISEITDWRGEFVSKRHYYRGLYPIAGTEGASQWELDFDVTKIDQLFPLTSGNITSFSGSMIDVTNNQTYRFWSKIIVKGKKPFLLPSGAKEVYILKIKTEYDFNGETKRSHETIYYSPELQLNLKGVMHDESSQRYWRVISIAPPSPDGVATTPRRRRAGTVMI